jgi:hypothetical protein
MNLNNNNMDFRNRNNLNKNQMNLNNNNMDFRNGNNIYKNRMNEVNNRVQNDFYFKQFEGTKKQIPAQKKIEMSNYDRELLKLFIYIYYYEKIVLEKNIFYNSEKDFYLINPEWIMKFKELFSCDKLEKKLELFSRLYNYNNLNLNIDFIIDNVYEEDIFMKGKNFPGVNLIMTSISKTQNITYTNPGIIIPLKIMNIIKILNEDIKKCVKPKNFYFQSNQSNLVYYINNPKIIVGYLNNNIKFVPNYIFEFTNNLVQSEIDNIIFTPINVYINQKKLNPKQFFQQIFEENKPIGKLLILNQGKKYYSKSMGKYSIKNNPIKNKEIEIININNNLDNIKLKTPEKELASKNKQNANIKYELDNSRKERKLPIQKNEEQTLPIQKNEEQTKEITALKSKIAQLEKIICGLNQKNQQKEIAINEDLKEKQKNLSELDKKYQISLEKNSNLQRDNLNLKNINDKLNNELQQYKAQLSKVNNLINEKENNYNNEINNIKKELNYKNEQILNTIINILLNIIK